MRPTVSVITPVRNGLPTIVDAVDSILNQVVPDWEMIIVDDGSDDATIKQLACFDDDRILVFSQGKLGRSAARNLGLSEFRGDYLLFLDADDWLLPNAFHDHLRFLNENPQFGVSVSDGHFCDENGRDIVSLASRRGDVVSGRVLDRIVLDMGLVGASMSAMIRGQVVRDFGLRFDTRLDFGEDWRFWVEAARFTSFGFLDSLTCKYRWHGSNTTLRTSVETRRRQIWSCYKTILEANFFQDLAWQVREAFFFKSLARLLVGRYAEQLSVLNCSRFREMPHHVQARLVRQMAADYLLEGSYHRARECLSKASSLNPFDVKQMTLRMLMGTNPKLARAAVRLRRRKQLGPDDPLFDGTYSSGASA